MKTVSFYLNSKSGDNEFVFYIGQNQRENFDVIDKGGADDYWFHARDMPSCHVVLIATETDTDYLTKKERNILIKHGSLLCKENTNSLKSMNKVEFIYTKIKNVKKTKIPGQVILNEYKIFAT